MGERFQEPAGKGGLRIQKLIDRCGIDAGHCDVGFRNDIYLPHNASEVRQFPKQVAGAKHGIRALAQSMARELGPLNIHVAHVVVDGAIDTDFIRDNFPEKYALKDQDGILNPEHIAENYWYLHSQPRDAWTFELDLRPWNERW